MDDFLEFVVGIFVAFFLAAGIFFGVFSLVEGSEHDYCHERGELLQTKVTYRQWDGCYVKQGNLWMPFDVWKYNRDNGIQMK